MTCQELKLQLEKNIAPSSLLIFYKSESFLADQYIRKISEIHNIDICYISSINDVIDNTVDIFNTQVNSSLYIFKTDSLGTIDNEIFDIKNLIIVTDNISDNLKSQLKDYIIEFPKLEDWCIIDYVHQNYKELDKDDLDLALKLTKNNIYRLTNELDKIMLFDKKDRKQAFKTLLANGIFSDLTLSNIFTFTDAIITRDKNKLLSVLKDIENADVEPLGVVTVLNKNFKNIIDMQLSINPSADKLGLTAKQFYALKYKTGYYSSEQLINIFKLVSELDQKLKLGELPANYILDYIILNIMG